MATPFSKLTSGDTFRAASLMQGRSRAWGRGDVCASKPSSANATEPPSARLVVCCGNSLSHALAAVATCQLQLERCLTLSTLLEFEEGSVEDEW